ncbi:MAG TPA: signal peptidase I [Pyrinomonadaceae bacterium]|nr:signal peptidase I [Pyrinomonadaceae bacterium]
MRTFIVCSILIFCFLAIGCSGLGLAYRIPTANMSPTLNPGDACTSNPLAYISDPVERFDIVVFNAPESTKKRTGESGDVKFIARVIGLPNEKIEIKKGRIFINDNVLDEPFQKIADESDFPAINIPDGEYFILGDNRPNSEDSRFYKPATIKKADITGKVGDIYPGYYKKDTQ